MRGGSSFHTQKGGGGTKGAGVVLAGWDYGIFVNEIAFMGGNASARRGAKGRLLRVWGGKGFRLGILRNAKVAWIGAKRRLEEVLSRVFEHFTPREKRASFLTNRACAT